MKKSIFSLQNCFYLLLIFIALFLLEFGYVYFMTLFIMLFIFYFIRKNSSILIVKDELDLPDLSVYEVENSLENKVINTTENININKTNIKSPSYLGVENNNINFQEGDLYERRNKILKRLFFKTNDRYSYEKEFRLRKEKQLKYSRQARKANIEAEESIQNLYKIEISRNRVIVEAMFKSGKACRYNLIVIYRKLFLITKKIMKKIDN